MSESIVILASIAAVVATVLAFIFIVPEKKKDRLNGFGKFLHNLVNFKFLIIEKIFQALYILATAFSIAFGFFMLFYVQKGYSYYGGSYSKWYGGYGLLFMIVGPIAIRIAYEFIMMAILLVKNVISINNKLKNQNDGPDRGDPFAVPGVNEFKGQPAQGTASAPQSTYQPQADANTGKVFCTNCGTPSEPGTFCTNCGTKIDG